MLYSILLLLFIIFFSYLSYCRPKWSAMFILATLPSYLIRFSFLGIPFTALEIMILISFAIWFFTKTEFKNFLQGKYGWNDFKENRRKRIPYPFGMELILILVISFVAASISGFSASSLGIWKAYFFEPVLFYILILNVFAVHEKTDATTLNISFERKVINLIMWPLSISCLAISSLAFYQWFTGNLIFNDFWANAANRRVVSFFGYPNSVSLFLGPIILIMIGWFMGKFKIAYFENKLEKKAEILKLALIFIIISASLISVYFTKSKGALIAIGLALISYVVILAAKKIKIIVLIFLFASILSIVYIKPLNFLFMDKIVYSKSMQIREQQWKETWAMLKNGNMITGAGLANYQNIIAPYHQEGIFLRDYNDPDWHKKTVFNAEYRAKAWQPTEIYLYPHNIILNFWSELGLAGVLLFIWIIFKFFVINFKNWKLESGNSGQFKFLTAGLVCAMAVGVLHGLVDVPYFKNDLSVLFWALIAMSSIINLNLSKKLI